MNSMTLITTVLQGIGAGDAAIAFMGPTLTILFAWIGGTALAQLVKFPLARVVGEDWHGYLVRIVGVLTAFGFAHYLSNHLSVPLEVLTAVTQPLVYALLQGLAERYAPTVARYLFRSVGPAKP